MADIQLSVVIPTFRSEKHLGITLQAVEDALVELGMISEVVVVDDGSPDGTWPVLETWVLSAERAIRATGILLRRNVGQHSATLCGLRHATGDFVVTLDDDLQNDPAEIVVALNHLRLTGSDVVIAGYPRQVKAISRKVGTKLVDAINTQLFGKPSDLLLSPFRLMTRETVDRVVTSRIPEPYLTGEMLLASQKTVNFPAIHQRRIEGKSTYSLTRLLELFRRIIVNYSTKPLRWIVHSCAAMSLVSLVISAFVVVSALARAEQVPGWSSTVCVISLFSGLILFALAVIAEYLSSLIALVSERPQYEVQRLATSSDSKGESR